uniref:DUF5405 domain-containing protein n=1 Tax=viral metagenome TaxID=1070528 RepID=A0A6M3LEW6_9ZZZZ
MLIGKNWKIESDSMNVILSRLIIRKPKDGSPNYEDWEIVGFYSSLANALKGLINHEVLETEFVDLQIVVALIDELHRHIDKALGE